MKARLILRLLTLTSWLPLAACATSEDDVPDAAEANAENSNEAANGNNANSANNANTVNGNANESANAENGNVNANASNNENVGNDEENNFSDDSDKEIAEAAEGSPASNAAGNFNGFEDNVAAEGFTSDPTANAMPAVNNEVAPDPFQNTTLNTPEVAANNTGINQAPANIAPVVDAPPPAPAPAPVAEVAAAPAVVLPPAPLASHDVESTPSTLHWVGYKINETLKKLEVEIITKGRPEFEIFEQVNRIRQNELIIRLYRTHLRQKLHWDVDSSEFRSPVAYIRMRNKPDKAYVDVVITHRDPVEPLFYHKDGNFLLSYAIPERYHGAQSSETRKIKDKAVSLNSQVPFPLAKAKTVSSNLPTVGFPRYKAQFKEVPNLQPIRKYIGLNKKPKTEKDGLPGSFDKKVRTEHRTGLIVSRKTLVGVAQDNLENDFADDEENLPEANNAGNNANAAKNNLNAANNANVPEPSNAANFGSNSANTPSNADLGGAPEEAAPNAFSDLSENAESGGPKNAETNASNSEGVNPSNTAARNEFNAPSENPADAGNTAPIESAPTQAFRVESQDVEPQQAGGKVATYSGKPIFMEFYESPLNLVLKSFQEETGNNFIYPSDIGGLSVTIRFKGVPWDAALKAILETYSLGMVRVADNVVRIDKIDNLTGYMKALEAAKQYETRRVPTKVVVFRINNAVAKDMSAKIATMLAADIAGDPRIKITDDDRSNTVVIEAPEMVLAKAGAIIKRLDLETPQVEIVSRIVEVIKSQNDFFGVAWGNNLNFDPGRALGFGTLNFPNSFSSAFSVDPDVSANASAVSTGRFRLGSLNKFLDLDLLLKMEQRKGTSNVLQSNRVLVLDGQAAKITAGSSQFFRPAAGGNIINPGPGAGGGGGGEASGLSEIKFDLSLDVTPQVTALGNVIMTLQIKSDTPAVQIGEALAGKNTRELNTQMVRASGDTGVIGGIYDTKRQSSVAGIPFLSDLPIIGALFRSTTATEIQTELLVMVTPTIISGAGESRVNASASQAAEITPIISRKAPVGKGNKL